MLVNIKLIFLCVVIVVVMVLFVYFWVYGVNYLDWVWVWEICEVICLLWVKIEFGILWYIYFFVFVYLVWIVVGEYGKYLFGYGKLWGGFVCVV